MSLLYLYLYTFTFQLIVGGSILLYQTFIYPHIVKILGPVSASRAAAVSASFNEFPYNSSAVTLILHAIMIAGPIHGASLYLSIYDTSLGTFVTSSD